VLAGIPYQTFPDFEVGPLTIRTFGLMVGLGVVLGAWVAARDIERWGVRREDTYQLATRMVVAGLVGARLTWVLSHLDEIDSPVDVIAVWDGGIQFSGGFIAAVIVGFPTFRRWDPKLRWRSLDGYALGLTIGLAIGRIGCYAVGEHFGRTTDFFLGTTYEGGDTQESAIGDVPLVEGMTFHNTALYELTHLLVLFAVMLALRARAGSRGRTLLPGTIMGLFVLWYGVGRFVTDLVRVNDETVLGLTGAQWMSVVLVPVGAWVLLRVRHRAGAAEASGAGTGPERPDDGTDGAADGTDGQEGEDPHPARADQTVGEANRPG
jgi:phosphatidylglycerol---prolipoprotein diacylglyceryl transferase